MGRFYDVVGYVFNTETKPGFFSGEVIEERKYFGDVNEVTRRWDNGENVNDNLRITNDISIVADAYAYTHFFAIKYVHYMGAYWKVTAAKVARPRIVLTLGGVYNGPVGESKGPSSEHSSD